MAGQADRPRLRRDPFADLPPPSPGELTLYAFGPGFGEAMVVHLPDGLWMVVDCCVHDGVNLPLALLDAFDVEQIDLLVLTHPDLDHIRGIDALLTRKRVDRVWRYPHGHMVRDFLALQLKREGPHPDRRLASLFQFHQALHAAIERGEIEVHSGGVDALRWSGRAEQYEVACVAPTAFDAHRMGRQFDAVLDLHRGGVEPSERLLAFLCGERGWSDRPNAVSLALAIHWGDVRLVLGGDVECGTEHPSSGWKGIVRRLMGDGRRPDRRALLRDPALVKVAHHGSGGAFAREAWDLHTHSRPVPLGLIMPFEAHRLPDLGTLLHLGERVGEVVLTGEVDAERLDKAGWHRAGPASPDLEAPVFALSFGSDGTFTAARFGDRAAYFSRSPAPPAASGRGSR